jgi:hypothetical protein
MEDHMKHYTQDDIVAWQVKTFGPMKDALTCLIRANTEMAEMLTHLNRGEHEKAAIEAADVMIVLAGYGKSVGLDLIEEGQKFYERQKANEKDHGELMGRAARASVELSLVIYWYDSGRVPATGPLGLRELHLIEDCVSDLHSVADKLGHRLRDLVDEKMAINEAREWNCNGDGTGSHVKKTDFRAALGLDEQQAPLSEGDVWVFSPGMPPRFMKESEV